MAIPRPKPHQPFPVGAKKVFGGVLYDVYQWPQRRFDGSTVTYERLMRRDSVVILPVTSGGKVLVTEVQQPGTDWYSAVPCGGIDEGEDPETAARRELMEETGYEPHELEFWYAHQIEHRIDWAIYYFVARGCRKVAEPDAGSGERTSVREISFEDFLRLSVEDDFQNVSLCQPLLKAMIEPVEMLELRKRLGL